MLPTIINKSGPYCLYKIYYRVEPNKVRRTSHTTLFVPLGSDWGTLFHSTNEESQTESVETVHERFKSN